MKGESNMITAFHEDLIALLRILHPEDVCASGYSAADLAAAESACNAHFPAALKTVYETVGKDNILAEGFYAPSEIRVLHEPRTYRFKPCGEYVGYAFADHNGIQYAYYPFRRRDSDYKCYEKLERIFEKPHESFAHISDKRRTPDYSGFLDYFADIVMDKMKYIITFTGKKAVQDYVTICQGFGAAEFKTYLPETSCGGPIRHMMHCAEKGLLIRFDDNSSPKLQIGSDSAAVIAEISRSVKTKRIRDNGKKVIDPKYYFQGPLPEGFAERLALIYTLYFGKPAAGAEIPAQLTAVLPESLALFYQIMGQKPSFFAAPYKITPCNLLDTSGAYADFAVEEQGVCAYQIDLKSGDVYYKSDASFEKVPMSLDAFLLYLSALQAAGVMPAQAFLAKDDAFKPFFGCMPVGDQEIYINPKRRIIAFAYGEKILAAARNAQALQKLEEQCGLAPEYI